MVKLQDWAHLTKVKAKKHTPLPTDPDAMLELLGDLLVIKLTKLVSICQGYGFAVHIHKQLRNAETEFGVQYRYLAEVTAGAPETEPEGEALPTFFVLTMTKEYLQVSSNYTPMPVGEWKIDDKTFPCVIMKKIDPPA